ncbi:histidine--tRNA ligase [Neosynechococcus sphagnicola]|uniref:histidine--tRNA ligase n=1 Tax=Neosynechococcus sphagnicola TaxID=1501145 RepID=UPI000A4C77B7|nr:histidine--tRNA ligase [Neosynechococcus sphagnicola]
MAKAEAINYKPPSGFDIEFLPGEKRLEQALLDTIRQVFERYGFTPIETPAVERLEVLQAKGNQGDNILYSIQPVLPPSLLARNDSGAATEVAAGEGETRALKFDQTVPLAAYIARHFNQLSFPFARYQMDMVFRGERAKKGRYRQFRQCDIDVVGRGQLSLFYDAQVPAIIAEIFSRINIGPFLIRMNNRKILTGFFAAIAVPEAKIKPCIRIMDTLEKVGATRVKAALAAEALTEEQATAILNFIQLQGSADEMLTQLADTAQQLRDSEQLLSGVQELQTVIQGVRDLKVPEDQFCIDLAIARGLDYYTGTVYETNLIGYESLGSICSGGRYEDLVGTFVGETMPGVGISIGLTRLLRKLLDAQLLKPLSSSPAQVMVVNFRQDLMGTYLHISQQLRQAGINVLTVFEERSLGKQFQQADRLGIPLCVIMGPDELATGTFTLKT